MVADQVLTFEEEYRQLTPEQLRAKSDELKKRLADGEPPVAVLPEAFAALREASDRAQKHRHFHCQLIGGQVLYEGNVAEMRTGEGKTIVCHLAALHEGSGGQEGPRRHGQRLPGAARRRVRQADLRAARGDGRLHPVRSGPGRPRGRPPGRPTPATSPTAPTASSASTTCATT